MSQATLESFIESLNKRLDKTSAESMEIKYDRPKDLSPLEFWMKESLDAIGIRKIHLTYERDKGITTYNIVRFIQSSS